MNEFDEKREKTEEEKMREQRIKEFNKMLKTYKPDWEKIAAMPLEEGMSPEESKKEQIIRFGKAMKNVRTNRKMSAVDMGKRLSCSRQYVYRIEKGQINNFPLDKAIFCSELFAVPMEYLLGIIEKDENDHADEMGEENREPNYELTMAERYFLENPNSDFNDIKDEVLGKKLLNPMWLNGITDENLTKIIENEVKKDYQLMWLVGRLTQLSSRDKKLIYSIL